MKKQVFAKKSLGQNFLRDEKAIEKIVQSVPDGTSLLLEIGPGRGALSCKLFLKTKFFCALEKDDLFAKEISETIFVHGSRNHFIFHDDALNFDWDRLWIETKISAETKLVVAANLPYNVATEILFRLVDIKDKISFMVLMFQKEVAQRLAATPGSKQYGVISAIVQNYFDIKIQQILKPGAFTPAPKVESAVLEFRKRENPQVVLRKEEEDQFFSLVRAGFAHRRKTLENSLAHELPKASIFHTLAKPGVSTAITRSGLDSKVRAEMLTLQQWYKLYKELLLAVGGA